MKRAEHYQSTVMKKKLKSEIPIKHCKTKATKFTAKIKKDRFYIKNINDLTIDISFHNWKKVIDFI